MKTLLEYVWLDADEQLRSKIKIAEGDLHELSLIPKWSYDGSSTGQAPGNHSDVTLTPVKIYYNPFHINGWLVMCETEKRKEITIDSNEHWFGFEQEYFIMGNGRPLGWPSEMRGDPAPQGPYYCGVGASKVAGRDVVSDHMIKCMNAGLDITGTNAEVALGQWEYQLFSKGAANAADDLWISRYILERVAESHGYDINFHPKPVHGDWNGSGLHTNFSTEEMRTDANVELFVDICEKFADNHAKHIAVYGKDNDQRLTGLHETHDINTFSYGEGDRGASIRIPIGTIENNYKSGYLEDRRPASNANPYDITKVIINTIYEERNTKMDR